MRCRGAQTYYTASYAPGWPPAPLNTSHLKGVCGPHVEHDCQTRKYHRKRNPAGKNIHSHMPGRRKKYPPPQKEGEFKKSVHVVWGNNSN